MKSIPFTNWPNSDMKCFHIFSIIILPIDSATFSIINIPDSFSKFITSFVRYANIFIFNMQMYNSTGANSSAYCGKNIMDQAFFLK